MMDYNPDDGIDDHNQCQTCGSHISATFRRCYGDDDGRVHACPHCATYRDLFPGVEI